MFSILQLFRVVKVITSPNSTQQNSSDKRNAVRNLDSVSCYIVVCAHFSDNQSTWISQKMTICLWHEGKMFYFSIPRTVSRQVTDEPRSLLRLHKYYLIPLCIAEVPNSCCYRILIAVSYMLNLLY